MLCCQMQTLNRMPSPKVPAELCRRHEASTTSSATIPQSKLTHYQELEELDDIRAYDDAKAHPQEAIPFEQAVR